MVPRIRKIINQKLVNLGTQAIKNNLPPQYKNFRPKEYWGNPQTNIPDLKPYKKYKPVTPLKKMDFLNKFFKI